MHGKSKIEISNIRARERGKGICNKSNKKKQEAYINEDEMNTILSEIYIPVAFCRLV